jgi:hypothetical protein
LILCRAFVDLTRYECDKTHHLKLPIENGTGTISIQFSLTGLSSKVNDGEIVSSCMIQNNDMINKDVIIIIFILNNKLNNLFLSN